MPESSDEITSKITMNSTNILRNNKLLHWTSKYNVKSKKLIKQPIHKVRNTKNMELKNHKIIRYGNTYIINSL